jgi:hypothetical protein
MCSLQYVARLRQRDVVPAEIVRSVVCYAQFFKRSVCSTHRLQLPPLIPRQIGGNAAFCGFPVHKSGARGPSQLHNIEKLTRAFGD